MSNTHYKAEPNCIHSRSRGSCYDRVAYTELRHVHIMIVTRKCGIVEEVLHHDSFLECEVVTRYNYLQYY